MFKVTTKSTASTKSNVIYLNYGEFVERRRLCGAAKTGFPPFLTGAGEGNRTLVVSLGSFCSTIELHPRSLHFTRLSLLLATLQHGCCDRKCDGRFLRGVMACVSSHQIIVCISVTSWISSTRRGNCLDSWDHVPMRSWPLFKARQVLRTLFQSDLSLVA